MSNDESPDPELPGDLDDPDWIDKIVAKAMESAGEAGGESSTSTPPTPAPTPAPQAQTPVQQPAAPRVEPQPKPAEAPKPAELSAPVAPVTPPARPTQPVAKPAPAAQTPPASAPTVEPQSTPVETAKATSEETTVPKPAAASVFADEGDVLESLGIDASKAADDLKDLEVDDAAALVVEDEPEPAGRSRAVRWLVEWVAVLAGAIAVAFLVKTFLIQAFYIPSVSMEPSLEVNDRILVNKQSYTFGDPSPGDLVVFERPENLRSENDDLVKRVIAVEGETIELVDGQVFIDGRGLNEPYTDGSETRWLGFLDPSVEELCGGVDVCTVPPNHVFVMGDNRDGSTDSRAFGPIHEDRIVGRAFIRIYPIGNIGWL